MFMEWINKLINRQNGGRGHRYTTDRVRVNSVLFKGHLITYRRSYKKLKNKNSNHLVSTSSMQILKNSIR